MVRLWTLATNQKVRSPALFSQHVNISSDKILNPKGCAIVVYVFVRVCSTHDSRYCSFAQACFIQSMNEIPA